MFDCGLYGLIYASPWVRAYAPQGYVDMNAVATKPDTSDCTSYNSS